MRSCCAVYVDVGYLLAAAATRVTGSSLRRGVQTDYAQLIEALAAQAQADSGLPLLRINWYDAGGRPGGMPDLSQDEIGLLPNVKLRLGRLSYTGEQKGVDVRIGLDLTIQARQRVADVVYLVSGDDDLTEAVEEAQDHGVQVVLLAVPRNDGKPLAAAKHLMREVDRLLVIDPETIDAAVRPTAIPEALVPAPAGEGDDALDGADETDDAGAPARIRRRVTRVAGKVVLPEGVPLEPAPPAPPLPSPPPTPAAPASGVAGAGAATGERSPEGEPTPSMPPSPALFARRKAGGVTLPGTVVEPTPPATPQGLTSDVVDAVARQVVASWCSSATPDALVALRGGAPTIPSELDRALLLDLSSLIDGSDLDDETRHGVRARFWYHIGRVRPV